MVGKKYKIRHFSGELETHEVFLDTLAHKREQDLGISEKKFEVKIKERLMYGMLVVFAIFIVGLSFRTFYFQIVEGKDLQEASQNNKGKVSLVRAERGIIYDKNFKKLVSNSPAYDVICDKRTIDLESEEAAQKLGGLGKILGKEDGELREEILTSQDSKVVVAENISQETLLVLEARRDEFADCQIEKNTTRDYAYGSVFAPVLGYMGKVNRDDLKGEHYTSSDYIGKIGIEKSYEEALRGIPGKLEIIRTATGLTKGDRTISESEPGDHVVLNIDAGLQSKVYESLEKSIKNIGAKKGAAVALDPRNGKVLALVSYPSYDNNIFSKGISQDDYSALQNDPTQPFFNRAIAAQYSTGSTIKPFLASAALQEKLISPEKLINDQGQITIRSKYDPSVTYTFSGVKPHGLVDMRRAIAVSSNIYFYTIGGGYENQAGLGPTRIKKYLGLYGWEQKTGIDIPGEFSGFVPGPEWKKRVKKESWWDGDTYNLSIGQSDLQVTPLHVAVAYAAIANGGTLYKPQVVQKIIDSAVSGTGSAPVSKAAVLHEFAPEIKSQGFIDDAYLQIIREGMLEGVQEPHGSSYMLSSLPVAVAGKTGTVETNKDNIFNTWSSNFAPYENPEIVFVATIEGVEGLQSATLPVARDVLQYYFQERE